MIMGLPTIRSLSGAYLSSSVIAVGLVVASAAGLAGDPYGTSALVLVSRGADAANLVLVLPILLGSMWLARRGSLIGLLLWPGGLFYVLYAYVPYVVGAPFTALFFVHVGLVTLSAFTIIGILASIDAADVRQRLARAPARSVGGALVVIALLAYAGLIGVAIRALGDPTTEAATRPLAVADWVVGTPVLVIGGLLLLGRAALGYVVAPGLLLVSGLGGVAFAIAAVVDNVLGSPQTEPAVIAIHLVIATISIGLLAYFVRGAIRRQAVVPPAPTNVALQRPPMPAGRS
jgi:hypothetical protein